MKRSILFLAFFIFTFSLFSQVPDYEFIVEPTELMLTYYDYMPGGYNSIPIRIQPEISYPNGYPAGGIYIVYHAQELGPTSMRKVYYCYLDSEGNLVSSDLISTNDVRQGCPGMDIDPISCDPIASWHAVVEIDNSYDCLVSVDVFHELGSSGNWTAEFIGIDNPEAGQPTTGFIDDEFIWPAVFISSSSPLGGDYSRVFVTGNNYTPSHGAIVHPCENVLFGYADFLSSDLLDLSSVDWNYITIEQMDAWNTAPPYIYTYKSCAVFDNIVVYAGYLTNYDNDISDVFVFVNENYGEGDFEYYSESYLFDQWNPLNEDGTAYLYSDETAPLIPYIVIQEIIHSGHMNVIIKDNGSKISWPGCMGITFDALNGNGPGYYYPNWCQIYPKEFVFDLNTHEFSFYDLYIEGANPDDNIPMCPWDLDEDGIVDSFSVTGDPLWVYNWPIYYPDGGEAFHENYFKIAQNENWIVSVWSDGTKAKRFYDGNTAFAAWEDTPEIAIVISADNGQTWSQPILLNANETPELADQIPCYIYPGDVIEILSNVPEDYHGKVHLFYLDDNDFGSNVLGNGLGNGGNLMYTALDIEFPDAWIPGSSTENEEVPQPQIRMYNYPNPFNPSTTIQFTTEHTENTELMIYNMKGQKVKTLNSFPNRG
ncbi:MAG: T9SS type A sorting domain-containing protein, partial [Candidatus Cloacimonetes bacterium]|nr:T9SS type A sorting domain-containing protein [Candidatus Cloacimonadota bacterium]